MKSFLRVFADYWIAFFMLTLSLLFAVAYADGTHISFNMVIEVFMLPGWGVLGLFFLISLVLFIVRLPWYVRALVLLPVIIYALCVPFAYYWSGGELIAGLIAGHIYGGLAITMILQIGVLNSNHEKDLRDQENLKENHRLLGQIELYRKMFAESREALARAEGQEAATNGTN
jgi:hypothetical protein